MITTHKKTLHV